MPIKRRNFLLFLGIGMGVPTIGRSLIQVDIASKNFQQSNAVSLDKTTLSNAICKLSFPPVNFPIPLPINQLSQQQQIEQFSHYEVLDDLVLSEGLTYDVLAAWGDRVGDSRFGYNNDYLSFVETGPNQGLLTINFEYISGKTWQETYPLVIKKSLPFRAVKSAIASRGGKINTFALPETDPLKQQIILIAREGLTDQGIGVIGLKHQANGQWRRTFLDDDRRISGITGLDQPQRSLRSTGPAVLIFQKKDKFGYDDGLGNRIIGTFQNCAGGTTPWGTVFSAEENFQIQVPEAVMADGSSLPPSALPFVLTDKFVAGLGNVFGLAGNKYGWMVEVDPANPNDWGTKHTWLGRYRHEAFGIRAESEKKLAVYSGCDRRGGHIYKFISRDKVVNPKDKANSRLLENGMLYGAKFHANGTGQWIPLNPETRVDPVLPSQVSGNLVLLPNPNRQAAGYIPITTDSQAKAFQAQFTQLGELYPVKTIAEKQGAILIDAHYAANAAGITCTARPEDTIIALDGILYIAFTSGSPGREGSPDRNIFKGPTGQTDYEYGWLVKLSDIDNDPASLGFRWEIFAMGGDPTSGGAGFANPDNIEIDANGNLWMVTDMSTSKQNLPEIDRHETGQTKKKTTELGIFGNNSLWYLPTTGENAGEAYPVAIGPMECECTGPYFSPDQKTLFLSIQHPGEQYGTRHNFNTDVRDFELLTTNGNIFKQKRTVPLGSNWPGKATDSPPRPAVVAIRALGETAIS